jgi:hypothetical protein
LRVTNHGGTELKNNDADAFIVKRIKEKAASYCKANLSEWPIFFA